jgi:hypothetical protein
MSLKQQIYLAVRVGITISFILLFCSSYRSQNWNGIVPGASSCTDVGHFLEKSVCGQSSFVFESSAEIVVFSFAQNSCHEYWPFEDFDLPKGSVTAIRVSYRHPFTRRVAEFGIAEDRFVRSRNGDQPDILDLVNEEYGLKLSVNKAGLVIGATFLPGRDVKQFDCRSRHRQFPAGSVYGSASTLVAEFPPGDFESVVGHLKRAVSIIEKTPTGSKRWNIYVIYYMGRIARRNEGSEWLGHVQNLFSGIKSSRDVKMLTSIGGHRDSSMVQIYMAPADWNPPVISPNVHPTQVTWVNGSK